MYDPTNYFTGLQVNLIFFMLIMPLRCLGKCLNKKNFTMQEEVFEEE